MTGRGFRTGVGWNRLRLAAWGLVVVIAALDASIATPLGLTWFYFAALALASVSAGAGELLVMALVCFVASVLFGPIHDPLGLRALTVVIPEEVQRVATTATAFAAYVGFAVLLRRVHQQRRTITGLQRDVARDALTGLGNRRALATFMSFHSGSEGAVLTIDLDHFKEVNDRHGHDAGDAVLAELGRRLGGLMRDTDLVARTGGEEFVAVLPGAGARAALRIAEEVRQVVRSRRFPTGTAELELTASVGAAVGALAPALLKRSDEAVYVSKREGRDRVTLLAPPAT